MVPSELIGEGSIGGSLVFLGCWSKGPYSVPDQQGDINNYIAHFLNRVERMACCVEPCVEEVIT